MFVGRKENGDIFGTSTVEQQWTTEKLPDDHAEVVAFLNRPRPERSVADRLAALGLSIDDLKEVLGLEAP